MTLVLTPVQMCALIHCCSAEKRLYLMSYQRTKRENAKPVESTAKFDSTDRSGKLERSMSETNALKISGFSSVFSTLLKCGIFPINPLSCASHRSDVNRPALNVE